MHIIFKFNSLSIGLFQVNFITFRRIQYKKYRSFTKILIFVPDILQTLLEDPVLYYTAGYKKKYYGS